jgi:hypothetical protein
VQCFAGQFHIATSLQQANISYLRQSSG